MTIDDLQQLVGQPYRQLDDNGKALGCMAPVYALYPDIPRFDWPPDDDFTAYVLNLLTEYGKPVQPGQMQPGDVLAFRMPFNFLHIGVYLGNGEVIHSMTGETMEIIRLSYVVRRINEVFRWQ